MGSTETGSGAARAGAGNLLPQAIVGVVAGIDNLTSALAMGALLFAGPLAQGMGLGVGAILLGSVFVALVVALRSSLPNSIGLIQESTVAILAAALASLGANVLSDPDIAVATAITIIGASGLITGIAFWTIGYLRLGALVRFLPYPVVAGFIAGSGWLLIDGAAIMLTGAALGPDFIEGLQDGEAVWRVLPAIAFALMLFVLFTRYQNALILPAMMFVAVAAFYLALTGLDISAETARNAGHLPPIGQGGGVSLPAPSMILQVDWGSVAAALPSILVVAGLSLIGLMLNVGGLEAALGRDIDIDRELRSTGAANMLSGAVGGPSGYVGLSMTLLAQRSGATGRGAGIVMALVMLAGLLFAGSLIFQLPVFFSAGFILFLGLGLLNEWLIDTRKRMPVIDWLIVVVILLTVILIGFMEGLAVGLVVSSAVFVFKYSRLPVVRFRATGAEQRSTVDRSPAAIKFLSEHGGSIDVVQLQGYLFFGTAERVVDFVRDRLSDPDQPALKSLVLDFRNVSGADSAAVSCFSKIWRLLEPKGVETSLSSVSDDLRHNMELAGLTFGHRGCMRIEDDLDKALEAAEEALLQDHEGRQIDESLLNHLTSAVGHHPRLPHLISEMTRLEMAPEEVLIRQGEDARDVYFLASGRVRVQITLPDGHVARVRTMLGGAIVGEVALYLDQPRTADVVVDSEAVIYRLSAEDFERLENDDPKLAALAHRLLASTLSEKLSVANKMIQVTRR